MAHVLASPARAAAASHAIAAEYAVRWDVAEGGPQTAAATVAALHLQVGDTDRYEVRYFDFTAPANEAGDATAILRQRVKNGRQYELTFKLRSDHPLSTWRCPLGRSAADTTEVDVSVAGRGLAARAYSYSCTLESRASAPTPPPPLQARPRRCASTMVRLTAAGWKIEEWHLPTGAILLEVSRNAADTPAALEAFTAVAVQPLLGAGIRPSDRSKTEFGGACE